MNTSMNFIKNSIGNKLISLFAAKERLRLIMIGEIGAQYRHEVSPLFDVIKITEQDILYTWAMIKGDDSSNSIKGLSTELEFQILDWVGFSGLDTTLRGPNTLEFIH